MIRIKGRLLAVGVCALAHFGCSCDDAESTDEPGGLGGVAGRSVSEASGGAWPDNGTGARSSGGAGQTTGGRDSGVDAAAGETAGEAAAGGRGPAGGAANATQAGAGGEPSQTGGAGGSSVSSGGAGGSPDVPAVGETDEPVGGAAGAEPVAAGGESGAHAAGNAGLWGLDPRGADQGGWASHSTETGGLDETGGAGGTGGVELTGGTSGTGGASGSACDPICGAQGCGSTEPDCLSEAYGLEDGDTVSVCVSPGSANGFTYCASQTCNGTPGCPLTIRLGTVDWLIAPRSAASSEVTLEASVTQVQGDIRVSGPATCTLTLVIPAASPLPAEGLGTLGLIQGGNGSLELDFDAASIATAGATVSYSPNSPLCGIIAGLALELAGPQIDAALLEALQSRAEPLTCLECRGVCPEEVACVKGASIGSGWP